MSEGVPEMVHYFTEAEVALEEAKEKKTPLGPRHLHWVHRDGGGHWLVRGDKKSSLCGTVRCREVVILEVAQSKDKLEVIIRSFATGPVPQEGYREF